jgi:hypothetical protein
MELPDEIREFFRQQGKRGARKRVRVLSPERRSEIARLAANARWSSGKKDSKKDERQ